LKNFIIILVLIISPAALLAAEPPTKRPHWSLEFKGGDFIPDIDNWSQFYGNRYTTEYGGSVAYKLLRPLEVGIEGSYIEDRGQGLAPLHNTAAGKVTYKLYPVNVFVLARGVFSEKQWLVPYVGGGWTRIFYREEVENQGVVRGAANGYHARAGLQLLLDGIDQSAAGNFYRDFGVYHTYLFLEAKYTRAMVDTVSGSSVNIGGTSWLGGFLFEF
jgi:hypothetical protein